MYVLIVVIIIVLPLLVVFLVSRMCRVPESLAYASMVGRNILSG